MAEVQGDLRTNAAQSGSDDDRPAVCPVQKDEAVDRVVVTRAADVANVLADRSLSSNPFNARPTALAAIGLRAEDRGFMTLAQVDGEEHTRLRRLITPELSAGAVAAIRPEIEAIADRLLDAIDAGKPFELVAACASPLPSLVIASLLGIEDAAIEHFRAWSEDLLLMMQPQKSEEDVQRMIAAITHLDAQSAKEIAARRASPRDDLIGALVSAEVDGRGLTDAEIINNVRLLLSAGNVTTTDLMTNAVVTLIAHREVLAELRDNPALWPQAIEELLRLHPPLGVIMRQPMNDRDVGGCPVEKGQTIAAILSAANHDPDLHRDAARFDIHRAEQKHFSFGGGEHFCPGASLARLELEIALHALFTRFPELALDPARPPQRKTHPLFDGYEQVWLTANGGF